MKTFIFILVSILIIFQSCTQKNEHVQPELGIRTVKIIEVDDYQFKDLNKNGELDKYEDWRLQYPNLFS